MAKTPTKATPDAIHTAADTLRALIERFVQPLLEAATALEGASDALVSAAEADQRRDRLRGEIAALGAELARDQQAAAEARAALPGVHDAAVAKLDAVYGRKHEALEADFTKTQRERHAVLNDLEQQITTATEELRRLRGQQTTARTTHQETLAGMTTKATRDAQAALTRKQALEGEILTLEGRVRDLRGEAQREGARLRELADRAGAR